MRLEDLPTTYEDRIVAWMIEDARRTDGVNFGKLQDEIIAAAKRGELSDEDAQKWVRAHQHAIESLVRQANALTRYGRFARSRA